MLIVFWVWLVRVALVMVLFTFLLLVLLRFGFRWDHLALAWSRLGLPMLSNLAGPIQHFRAAILDAWRNKVAADLCGRRVFVVCFCWMSMTPCSSLILLMLEKEIRLCFVALWFVVFGMVFSLTELGDCLFLVCFVVLLMVMVISFGNVPFLFLLRYVKILSFMIGFALSSP